MKGTCDRHRRLPLSAGGLVGAATLALAVGIGWSAVSSQRRGPPAVARPVAPTPRPARVAGVLRPSPTAPLLASVVHPVFSLLDNRLLAHMVRDGGLFVPTGYPGSAKYVTFLRPWNPWKLGHKEEGRFTALATRNVSWLRLPLTEVQAKAATTLTLSVKSPAAQGLSIKLNSAKLRSVKLASGWQKVDLAVPAGALWSGENRIELSWGATGRFGGQKASAALEWLHLGARPLADPGPTTPAAAQKLVLPAGGGLAWYVYPYRGAKLKLRFPAQPAGARCDLKVRLAAQGQKPVDVTRGDAARTSGEIETFVELDGVADRVARLDLLAEGSGCKQLPLAEAAIVMPGAAPKVQRAKDKAPKHILFWMMDNARGDRYTLYNPKTRVKTPVITELGRTGTVFTRAYIQGTESRVSHASIWTGAFPKQHNFIAPKVKLSLDWVTLPEAVKKAGFYTAAWIANGFVSKFWGFGEGWNQFRNHIHQGGGLTGAALVDHAAEFLQRHDKKKSVFIYLGTIDSHVSWRGRQPWLREYHPEPYTGPYATKVAGTEVEKMAGGRSTSPADRKRILAIYDSTVSYNDQQLGRMLQVLKDKGMRDETMIVITADHGEELWDYGKIGHGSSVKQELVAVPLVIHYPPLFGKGVVVKQGVDVLSLMPSILDAIGAPIPDSVQGESLLPLAHGVGTGYPRPSFASQYELAHAMRLERWKLWVGGQGEPTLFDLESKQGEHRDVAVSHPYEMRWLTDTLAPFLHYQARWRESRWGVASNHSAAIAEDLETGGGPGPIRIGRAKKKNEE